MEFDALIYRAIPAAWIDGPSPFVSEVLSTEPAPRIEDICDNAEVHCHTAFSESGGSYTIPGLQAHSMLN
jgi:hypothetical protein